MARSLEQSGNRIVVIQEIVPALVLEILGIVSGVMDVNAASDLLFGQHMAVIRVYDIQADVHLIVACIVEREDGASCVRLVCKEDAVFIYEYGHGVGRPQEDPVVASDHGNRHSIFAYCNGGFSGKGLFALRDLSVKGIGAPVGYGLEGHMDGKCLSRLEISRFLEIDGSDWDLGRHCGGRCLYRGFQQVLFSVVPHLLRRLNLLGFARCRLFRSACRGWFGILRPGRLCLRLLCRLFRLSRADRLLLSRLFGELFLRQRLLTLLRFGRCRFFF